MAWAADLELGHDAQALDELQRGRAIYEARLGPGSPKVAATLATEARALVSLGRRQEARAALLRALDIDRKAAAAGSDIEAIQTQLAQLDVDEAARPRRPTRRQLGASR